MAEIRGICRIFVNKGVLKSDVGSDAAPAMKKSLCGGGGGGGTLALFFFLKKLSIFLLQCRGILVHDQARQLASKKINEKEPKGCVWIPVTCNPLPQLASKQNDE